MAKTFYQIPLNISNLMEGDRLEICNKAESIKNSLELIIMTRLGENRYDPDFGSYMWNIDFELVENERVWIEKVREQLKAAFIRYETRLMDIVLEMEIKDTSVHNSESNSSEIKKRVTINLVSAYIRETGQPLNPPFSYSLFISPISKD